MIRDPNKIKMKTSPEWKLDARDVEDELPPLPSPHIQKRPRTDFTKHDPIIIQTTDERTVPPKSGPLLVPDAIFLTLDEWARMDQWDLDDADDLVEPEVITARQAKEQRRPVRTLGGVMIKTSALVPKHIQELQEYKENFQFGPIHFMSQTDNNQYDAVDYSDYLFSKPYTNRRDFRDASIARTRGTTNDYLVIRTRPFTEAGVRIEGRMLSRSPYVGQTGVYHPGPRSTFSRVNASNIHIFVQVYRATRPYNPAICLFTSHLGPPFMVVQHTPQGMYKILARTDATIPPRQFHAVTALTSEIPSGWFADNGSWFTASVHSPAVIATRYGIALDVDESVPLNDFGLGLGNDTPPLPTSPLTVGAPLDGAKTNLQLRLETEYFVTLPLPQLLHIPVHTRNSILESAVLKWHHPQFRLIDTWLRDVVHKELGTYLPMNAPKGHTWELSTTQLGMYNANYLNKRLLDVIWKASSVYCIHVIVNLGWETDAPVVVNFNNWTDTPEVVTLAPNTCVLWTGMGVTDITTDDDAMVRFTDITYHNTELSDNEMFVFAHRLEQMEHLEPLTDVITKQRLPVTDSVPSYTPEQLLLYIPQRKWHPITPTFSMDIDRAQQRFQPDTGV